MSVTFVLATLMMVKLYDLQERTEEVDGGGCGVEEFGECCEAGVSGEWGGGKGGVRVARWR